MEVDISGNIAENDGQKQRRSPRWKPGISVHATKCTSSDGSFERPVRSLFERTLSLTVRMLCVFLYFLCGEGCSRERPSVDLRMSHPHLLVVFHATCLPVYPICESLVDVRSLVMLTTVFLVCSDDGMGRFDRETISQQSLMELFIFGFDTAEDICGGRDDPREVCAREGIKCNADGEVKGFQWGRKGEDGDGTVGLAFLPLSMTYLSMYDGALRRVRSRSIRLESHMRIGMSQEYVCCSCPSIRHVFVSLPIICPQPGSSRKRLWRYGCSASMRHC